MTDWGAFHEQFDIWPVAQPFADLMFDEQEVQAVLALGERALTDSPDCGRFSNWSLAQHTSWQIGATVV